ncbi:MAG: hypothetical protein JRJ78_16745 [Deltaproteobacteria bacterium]|nr:hypothetical protein [Deltaproteobacteria bacterium]
MPQSESSIQEASTKEHKNTVLLIGDAMSDIFMPVGKMKQVRPLTYHAGKPEYHPGGASNTAQLLESLEVPTVCVYSRDYPKSDPIPIKLYLITTSDNAILLRLDRNDHSRPLDHAQLATQLLKFNDVVVSDYNKGTIDDKAIDLINILAMRLFVDTKRDPYSWRKDATFFPNETEFQKYRDHYLKLPRVAHKQGVRGARFLSYGTVKAEVEAPTIASYYVCQPHTIGAGDAFLAGWVRATVAENLTSDRDRLEFAVVTASLSCTYPYTQGAPLSQIKKYIEGGSRDLLFCEPLGTKNESRT